MKALTNSIVAVALFASWAGLASAQTVISGNIIGNTVWSAENSPYVLGTAFGVPVHVEPGAVLTVEPGVEVVASSGVRRLVVHGELVAGVLSGERVIFSDVEVEAANGVIDLKNTTVRLTIPGAVGTLLYAPSGSLALEDVHIIAPGVSYPVFFTGETDFAHASTTIEGALLNGFFTAGEYYGERVWTADNPPYIVDSVLDLYGSLALEAGVVVKGVFEPQISNYGTLLVRGTLEQPVYFTSYADDSVGGDTNSDGDVTVPALADWVGIINFGTADIAHAVVRYAGTGFENAMGGFSIANSVFSNNSVGVVAATFDDSSIFSTNNIIGNGPSDRSAVGLWNRGGQQIDARNNWWGDATGPYHATLNPTGMGDSVAGNVLFEPWLTMPPSEELVPEPEPEPQTIDPVIIIPGILGSWEKNGEWVIDPLFGVYNDLVDTLAANGYVQGQDLFTFPYNWRNSNVDTALLLKEKIDEVQGICECGKVDLVAHSMGGLVARQYIQSDEYENDVDQMIFLGTPHLGAPKAYLMWEAGENETDWGGKFLQLIFKNEAKEKGYPDIFSYLRATPVYSVRELLPVYNYLVDSEIRTYRDYPENYPRNIFLENLNDSISSLANRVKIENIIGSTLQQTITEYIVEPTNKLPKWESGEPIIGGIVRGDGDSTVPHISAISVVPDYTIFDTDHTALVSVGAGFVYKTLAKTEPQTVVDNGMDFNVPLLLFQLFSPVDMQILAPDGKRLGKDFESGEEVNEIPDAFYSGFSGENEYAIILNPLPGEYQINTIGTGSGSYTVVADYSNLESIYSTEVTKEVAEGQKDTHRLIVTIEENIFEFVTDMETDEELVIEEPPTEEAPASRGRGSGSSGSVLGASTARFTLQQIEAILGLLRAFGVEERLVMQVAALL